MSRPSPVLLLALWAAACGGAVAGPRPAPDSGVELVTAGEVVAFQERAERFYRLLEGRRFDSLATFRDPALRGFFRDERAFSDYYADLAAALDEAHFERNAPIATRVEEFVVEGPGRARVRVRLVGENALPLRWWETELVREDRWERIDGQWWIVPGRL